MRRSDAWVQEPARQSCLGAVQANAIGLVPSKFALAAPYDHSLAGPFTSLAR